MRLLQVNSLIIIALSGATHSEQRVSDLILEAIGEVAVGAPAGHADV